MDETQKKLAEELLFSEKKKKSFAKQLFFGNFATENVLPYGEPSFEELEKISSFEEKLEAVLQKYIDPVAIDKQADIPLEGLNELAKIGVLGMNVPKEYGGLGMSQYAYCRAAEKIARRCASTALFVNAHQSIGLKALLLFGTKEQKDKWLDPLAKGEIFAAFSLTEPTAGSDASGVQSYATWDSEKKVYRLNGKKQWTTNGGLAKVLTVMAKTSVKTKNGVEDKITAFLVTPDMPGFQVTAASLEKVGMRGTHTSNLSFTDVCIPEDHVLGPVGSGLRICLTVLDYGRTTFGATCTGIAKQLVEDAFLHAKTRLQFNRPLNSFGLVKKKLVMMSALCYAMESSTYLTASLVDRGVEDFMLEAAILKVFASESLWNIIYETMQIFGGKSFFTSAPYERMMRDARLNMIGEGANEVLRAFIGVVGMRDVGVDLKETLDDWKNLRFPLRKTFNSIKERFNFNAVKLQSSQLQNAARALNYGIMRFSWSVARLLAYYKEDIVEKQLALDRIATAAIAIYTSTAVLGRLDTFLQQKIYSVDSKIELERGLFYCKLAMHELQKALSGIFSQCDKDIESFADTLIHLQESLKR